MKKLYLILFLHCALSILHSIKAQDKTVILFENFENGISSTWSQEQVVGDYDWIIESGDLANPSGATSGTKRGYFKNIR